MGIPSVDKHAACGWGFTTRVCQCHWATRTWQRPETKDIFLDFIKNGHYQTIWQHSCLPREFKNNTHSFVNVLSYMSSSLIIHGRPSGTFMVKCFVISGSGTCASNTAATESRSACHWRSFGTTAANSGALCAPIHFIARAWLALNILVSASRTHLGYTYQEDLT